MSEPGNLQLESGRRDPRRGRSRLRAAYRLLLFIAVFMVAVVLVFPLVVRPAVQPPTRSPFGNPISVLVANQNMMPITDVEYSCEVSHLTQANGAALTGQNVLIRGTIRRIPGRQAITELCEIGSDAEARIQAAEFKITVSYRMYPWPARHTSVYYLGSQMDQNGRPAEWKVR